MTRKTTIVIVVLVGLILGYSLRWFEVAQSDRRNLKESINFVTSDKGSALFGTLRELGISRESVEMTFTESTLQIVVEVPDTSIDSVVEALKPVAPSYPISLEVRSERGPVFFLPNGVVDFRGFLERLNQTEQSNSEQGSAHQSTTAP